MTAWHGVFCRLRFHPGPNRHSYVNLVTSSSLQLTILMPSLARTPTHHNGAQTRDPTFKSSIGPSLQVIGLQTLKKTEFLSLSDSDNLNSSNFYYLF